MMEWGTRTITRVSDSANLRNTNATGPKFYRKGGAMEVEWFEDEANGEEISYSIVEIKKTLFNSYVNIGWRLFFDAEWNNKVCSRHAM